VLSSRDSGEKTLGERSSGAAEAEKGGSSLATRSVTTWITKKGHGGGQKCGGRERGLKTSAGRGSCNCEKTVSNREVDGLVVASYS